MKTIKFLKRATEFGEGFMVGENVLINENLKGQLQAYKDFKKLIDKWACKRCATRLKSRIEG